MEWARLEHCRIMEKQESGGHRACQRALGPRLCNQDRWYHLCMLTRRRMLSCDNRKVHRGSTLILRPALPSGLHRSDKAAFGRRGRTPRQTLGGSWHKCPARKPLFRSATSLYFICLRDRLRETYCLCCPFPHLDLDVSGPVHAVPMLGALLPPHLLLERLHLEPRRLHVGRAHATLEPVGLSPGSGLSWLPGRE